METLIIDRRTWGKGKTGGLLLDTYGKKCCLGFYCQAKRIKPILNVSMPSKLVDNTDSRISKSIIKNRQKKLSKLLKPSGTKDNTVTERLAEVNDSLKQEYYENPSLREKRIISLFKKLKVNVKFIN